MFLSLNMVTTSVLLSFLLISGSLAGCALDADLFITAPQEMDALRGSCLQIPCNFSAKDGEEFNSRKKITGVWIKTNSQFRKTPENVIFNSSLDVGHNPISITGNLSQRNCTTLFSSLITIYTDKYYFRVENEGFKATASCDPVTITVHDSPPRPTIEVPGDLIENKSVTITCSAFTPCPRSPPKLTWSLQHDPHNIIEENAKLTLTTKIQKTLTLSDKHDGLNITCSARYPVDEGKNKTAKKRKTLSVSYAPKDTLVSISPSGSVSSGSRVNLTCSSRAKPPVSRFTWFKSSKDSTPVSEGDFYSINADDRGIYYCEATNKLGAQISPEFQLKNEGLSSAWWIVVVVIIVLICAGVAIWWIKSKHRASQPDTTSQRKQSLNVEEPAVQEPARETETGDIHYGEIHFSRCSPGPSSVQDSGQQQDTLYAQVNVSKTTTTSGGPEDLYAEVKKK